jgi:hypothetical protein
VHSTVWAYPWDLLDEGLETSLARIAELGANCVSVATSYHDGMFLAPHNPRKKVHFLEDGVVYYRADSSAFADTEIKPVSSRMVGRDASQDPLQQIIQAAEHVELDVVAWTVTLHNSRHGYRYPQFTARNVWGDSYPFSLCPSHDAVRTYARCLAKDLGERYRLKAIELEAAHFMPFNHAYHHYKVGIELDWRQLALLSMCFCDACLARASHSDVDGVAVKAQAGEWLERSFSSSKEEPAPAEKSRAALASLFPGLAGYLTVREETVTSLAQEIASAVASDIYLIVPGGTVRHSWLTALKLDEISRHCQALDMPCYYQNSYEVRADIAAARTTAHGALHAGINICSPFTTDAANLSDKLEAAMETGADGFTFYNYGLASTRNLGWLEEALREAVGA